MGKTKGREMNFIIKIFCGVGMFVLATALGRWLPSWNNVIFWMAGVTYYVFLEEIRKKG